MPSTSCGLGHAGTQAAAMLRGAQRCDPPSSSASATYRRDCYSRFERGRARPMLQSGSGRAVRLEAGSLNVLVAAAQLRKCRPPVHPACVCPLRCASCALEAHQLHTRGRSVTNLAGGIWLESRVQRVAFVSCSDDGLDRSSPSRCTAACGGSADDGSSGSGDRSSPSSEQLTNATR